MGLSRNFAVVLVIIAIVGLVLYFLDLAPGKLFEMRFR